MATFEGGAGREIKSGLGNIGIAYYAQLKMSHDENLNLPSVLDGKHRYFGVAPEIDYPIRGLPRPLILSARCFVEFGNRVATEDRQLVVTLTYAEIKMPGQPASSALP